MGQLNAMLNLADAFTDGRGVQKDYGAALSWLKKGTDVGSPRAYNNLGLAYINGFGVERNLPEAFRLFSISAEKKNSAGMFNLAACYLAGRGTNRNLEKAEMYARSSAAAGYSAAQKLLNSIIVAKTATSNGASLEETTEFVQSKATDFGNVELKGVTTEGFPYSTSYTSTIRVKDGYLLTWTKRSGMTDRSKGDYKYKMIATSSTSIEKTDLRELKSDIEIGSDNNSCSLKLECASGKCVSRRQTERITFLPKDQAPLEPIEIESFEERNFIPLKDQNSCERMKKALGHLILLYGGWDKKDPF
jgi:TPR repeat protein